MPKTKIAARMGLLAATLTMLMACAPSNSDYLAAVKAQWPAEQQAMLSRAQILISHAAASAAFDRDFEQATSIIENTFSSVSALSGAKMAPMAKRNTKPSVGEQPYPIEAQNLRQIAAMSVHAVEEVRCMKNPNLSGDNCELRIILISSDGKLTPTSGRYRFDKVDGKLAVVGIP